MNHTVQTCGDLQLDLDARVAFIGESRVILTFEEFELLRRLVADPGRAFTRAELRATDTRPSSDRTVDSRIMRLRKKLSGAQSFKIETVPLVGYRCWAANTAAEEVRLRVAVKVVR